MSDIEATAEQCLTEVFRERLYKPVPLDLHRGGPREDWWLTLRAQLADSFARHEDTRTFDVRFERAMTGENYEYEDRIVIEPHVDPWMRPLLPTRVLVVRFDCAGHTVTVRAETRHAK